MATETRLDARLTTILDALVKDYEAQPEDRRRRMMHLRTGGGLEGMNSWGDDKPHVTRDDLDELWDFGLIDVNIMGSGGYDLKPSREGRAAIHELRREKLLIQNPRRIDLRWEATRPLLHSIVDEWEGHGASSAAHVHFDAAPDTDDYIENLRRSEALQSAGLVNLQVEQDGSLLVQPTIEGVMATRDWPGATGDALAEQVLSRIEAAIEAEPKPEKRRKLEGLRNAVMEVGTKTLAEVVSKSVGTAM